MDTQNSFVQKFVTYSYTVSFRVVPKDGFGGLGQRRATYLILYGCTVTTQSLFRLGPGLLLQIADPLHDLIVGEPGKAEPHGGGEPVGRVKHHALPAASHPGDEQA